MSRKVVHVKGCLVGIICVMALADRAFAQSAATPARAHSTVSARARADRVDAYIEAEMVKRQIPSLSLAVVQNGKVVKLKSYGLANMELNVPATPKSLYQIQSITKSFIACAMMLLAEDGKVGLDDRITKYLSGLPPAWSDVTIRQMLTHTSGIPSFVQDQGSGKAIVEFAQTVPSSDAIVAWAAARPMKFAPGEGRKYSSTGYHLAGMIIEKVTGRPWIEFLTQRIFTPLGMTGTRLSSYEDIVPNRAYGYNHFGDVPVNGVVFTPAYLASAAGGLLSSAEDMAKWEIALENGTILKPSTLAQMAVPVKLKNDSVVQDNDGTRHGLGWDLETYQGHRIMSHGGDHVSGYTANFSRFTDDKVGIIVLTNLMPLDIRAITRGVARFYVPSLAPAKVGIAEALGDLIRSGSRGVALRDRFARMRADTAKYTLDESEMNRLGYDVLYNRKASRDAVLIFELNAAAFPKSANVYDSLGEAYLVVGDTAKAIGSYRKSLELNPQNSNATAVLNRLPTRN